MHLAAWLKTMGPGTIISAAFAVGVTWTTLNNRLSRQDEEISALRTELASRPTAQQVGALEGALKALEERTEHRYLVGEDRDRHRAQDITIAWGRLNALEDKIGGRRPYDLPAKGPPPSPKLGDLRPESFANAPRPRPNLVPVPREF